MFFKWRRVAAARKFNAQIAGILKTPPLRLVDAPLSIVSMVSAADLQMYLLALKSFYRAVGRGKVVALVGEGLAKAKVGKPSSWRGEKAAGKDRQQRVEEVLRKHVPGIEIVDVSTVPLGPCKGGGTWERLLFLIDRSEEEYVIQLDSDTLTVAPTLPEVEVCVAENRAFTLGGRSILQQIEPMVAASVDADENSPFIFDMVEARFSEYPESQSLRYIRGSSAFVGLSRGGFHRHQIERFYRQLEPLFGDRFQEWGTEQVGSNFAVANSRSATVLPYPAYANYEPGLAQNANFVHFYGTYRFEGGLYAQKGQEVIKNLVSRHATIPEISGV